MNPISPVLPQDILLEIFSHLPITATPSVARVSKLWNRVIGSELAWKQRIANFVSKAFSPPPGLSYKEAYKRLPDSIQEEYPNELIELFENARNISKLPYLDIGSREIKSCHMPTIKVEEITAPIMRGKDKNGCNFLIFKLLPKDSQETMLYSMFQDQKGTTKWIYQTDVGSSDSVVLMGERGLEEVTNLMNGSHPYFKLSN